MPEQKVACNLFEADQCDEASCGLVGFFLRLWALRLVCGLATQIHQLSFSTPKMEQNDPFYKNAALSGAILGVELRKRPKMAIRLAVARS